MIAIKTNYNNAYIKKPKTITPSFTVFRDIHINEDESLTKRLIINIYDNLDKETFFTNYRIYIYVDDKLIGSCDKRSSNSIIVNESEVDNIINPKIVIKGYYFNDNNYQLSFNPVEAYIMLGTICSTRLRCSNRVRVAHIPKVYFNPDDNLLYETYENEVYSDPVTLDTRKIYLDILTNSLYKWNNERECYILI